MAAELTPIITSITLDLAETNNFDFVKAVQGDNETRYLYITLLNESIPYEINCESIVLRGTKPDGTGVFNYCTLSENGEVIVELTEQILAVPGIGSYEIALYGQAEVNEETDVLTTFPFRIVVDKANIDAEVITSTNEFKAITEIMGNAETLKKSLDTIQEAKESALQSKEDAALSATNAKTSETNAANSANITSTKAEEAAASADDAKTYKTNAGSYADSAAISASNAANSSANASRSAGGAAAYAGTASTKADEAANHATEAESYAHGGTGTRENEGIDNAQYYYQQSKSISESFAGALRPMGTVAFANLPPLSVAAEGDMYNVSDEFTTTVNFKEGSGNIIPAGSNIYKTADGYWDVLAGSPVTGVKGNAESSYRKGNVNLTKENIGLGNVPNVKTNDQTPTFTQAASRTNIGSGEKLSVILGKIAKWFSDLKTVAFTGSYSDLTNKPTVPAAVAVKGNSESSYRTGNVNLTPANIGALPLSGGTLTGDTVISKGAEFDAAYHAANPLVRGAFLAGKAGTLGIWNNTHDKWLVFNDANGNGFLKGNADTATRAAYVGSDTKNNGLSVRAYTGTPSVSGSIFLQEDFDSKCVNVGIDGLGGTGVTKALRATQDGNGNNIADTYLARSGGTINGTIFMNTKSIVLANSGSTYQGELYCNGTTTNLSGINYLNLCSPGIQCRNHGNTGWAGISASSFTNQSSERYKENIQLMTEERARNILDIDIVTFDYKDGVVDTHQKDIPGIIVERIEKKFPDVVHYRDIDGENLPDSADYIKFIPYLIKMVQLQHADIHALKETVEKQNDIIASLL